jgi:hypothetical protein
MKKISTFYAGIISLLMIHSSCNAENWKNVAAAGVGLSLFIFWMGYSDRAKAEITHKTKVAELAHAYNVMTLEKTYDEGFKAGVATTEQNFIDHFLGNKTTT